MLLSNESDEKLQAQSVSQIQDFDRKWYYFIPLSLFTGGKCLLRTNSAVHTTLSVDLDNHNES